ncbi:MAG: hypothetical protein M3Z16_08120 [Pseudomonadota bacterium]|nr:hypothetical protein [Pseudomonadota bacterium]
MKFAEFFEKMAAADVDYVLVGGLAVSLQGAVRGTLDVDIVLAMNDDNLGRFVSLARDNDLRPSLPVSLESLSDAAQLDMWHREKHMLAFSMREPAPAGLVVDVLIRPSVAFDELKAHASIRTLGQVPIPVASVEHLINLKTGTGRAIDALDIDQLRRLQAAN